jgi:hypothetical protein
MSLIALLIPALVCANICGINSVKIITGASIRLIIKNINKLSTVFSVKLF